MYNIKISIPEKDIEAELNQTGTSKEIIKKLPIEATANRWGDEIYFSIPVKFDLEDGVEIVEEGTLAFWPPGNAFCIFFGPTPASTDNRPRAASAVTVIGKIKNENDLDSLRKVKSGHRITLKS